MAMKSGEEVLTRETPHDAISNPILSDTHFDAQTPQGRYAMTASQLVDELTYRNYAWNRKRSPAVTPDQWATVYGSSTAEMERRFQREEAASD